MLRLKDFPQVSQVKGMSLVWATGQAPWPWHLRDPSGFSQGTPAGPPPTLSLEPTSWGTIYPGTCPVASVPQARSFPLPPCPSLPHPPLGLCLLRQAQRPSWFLSLGSNPGLATGSLYGCCEPQ